MSGVSPIYGINVQIPLLVDEAWGGHFGFHRDAPTAAVQAGADIAVRSLHKAAGGLWVGPFGLVTHALLGTPPFARQNAEQSTRLGLLIP
jgi:hypothetical protein